MLYKYDFKESLGGEPTIIDEGDYAGVICDAELMGSWLDGMENAEMSAKLLFDLQTILKFYGDIIVSKGDVCVDYPFEGRDNTSASANVSDLKVFIPINNLVKGQVDHTISTVVHELTHLEFSPNFSETLHTLVPLLGNLLKRVKLLPDEINENHVSAYTILCQSTAVGKIFKDSNYFITLLENPLEFKRLCMSDKHLSFLVETIKWGTFILNVWEDHRVDKLQPAGTVKYHKKYLSHTLQKINPDKLKDLVKTDFALATMWQDSLSLHGFDCDLRGLVPDVGFKTSVLNDLLENNSEKDILPYSLLFKEIFKLYDWVILETLAESWRESESPHLAAESRTEREGDKALRDFLEKMNMPSPNSESFDEGNLPGDYMIDRDDLPNEGTYSDSSIDSFPKDARTSPFQNGTANLRGDSSEEAKSHTGVFDSLVDRDTSKLPSLDLKYSNYTNSCEGRELLENVDPCDYVFSTNTALQISSFKDIKIVDCNEQWSDGMASYTCVIVDGTKDGDKWNTNF